MANLYGIVPIKKVVSIIMEQNAGKFTKKQLVDFSNIARHENDIYSILGDDEVYSDGKSSAPVERTLYDFDYLYDNDFFYETRERQQGKEYYIPKKTEFLRHSKDYYYENTPGIEELEIFISKKLGASEWTTKRLLTFIYNESREMSSNVGGALEALNDFVRPLSQEEAETFLSLYTVFRNNTRLHIHLGHTPNEMMDTCEKFTGTPKFGFGPGIRELIKNKEMDPIEMLAKYSTMNLPNEAMCEPLMQSFAKTFLDNPEFSNVGRNDSCPCGSGKKYKKCCGK